MNRILILLFSNAALVSCVTDYACSEYPETGCQPVSAVHRKTNDGYRDYRKGLYNEGQDSGRKDVEIKISETKSAMATLDPGNPILTKPVILRVLLAPWEDSEKDLDAGGYLFIKVRDSQWSVK